MDFGLFSTPQITNKSHLRSPRYAILEIKLQDVSEAPLWLRQTLNDIGAESAWLFKLELFFTEKFAQPAHLPNLVRKYRKL